MINDMPDRPIDPPEDPVARELDEDEAYEIERQRELDDLLWAREELDRKIEAHKSKIIKDNAREIADSIMECLKDIGGRK